jgi:two-component system NtrC family response regulator
MTMDKPLLLVIDDDEDIRTQMKWALADAYEILQAGDRGSALELMRRESPPPVVLLDLGLPPNPNDTTEGFRALGELLSCQPLAKIVVITGQSDKANAMRAIGEGAYDFLCKPIDTAELTVILHRAFHVASLEREYRRMQDELKHDGFEDMLGLSVPMQGVFTSIRKLATSDVPVLILGESGTGKEMAAKAIHRRSLRKDGPFIAINCSAIPETLLEGELFGHEKGAFTGAHAQNHGRIEMAENGTLFLDEVGELPSSIQVKLLRFLQEHTISRVGGRKELEINARVMAATNADLKGALTKGTFREDLYYRLAVVELRLPPLRERPGDITVIAKALLERVARDRGRVLAFTGKALRAMENYSWPGNVREMDNRIKRAVIMADGKLIAPADLEIGSVSTHYEGVTLREAREAVERDLIRRGLGRHKGNISKLAPELGVSRPTLYELMEKLKIEKD